VKKVSLQIFYGIKLYFCSARMHNHYKVYANIKTTGIFFSVLLFITLPLLANNRCKTNFQKSLTVIADTVAPKQFDSIPSKKIIADTLNPIDSIKNTSDTLIDSGRIIKVDTTLFSKDSLDAPIHYTADDSGVLVIPTKQFILYGKAHTDYNDIKLDANTIKYDQGTSLVTAYGGTDTSKGALNLPTFAQGDQSSIMDTVFYNLKSQKGITKNTYYKEGELFVNAQTVKKVDKDVEFAYRGRFTTCNLDTPHFDIRARKMKIINNKIAVSGPAVVEFEGVPTPIVIPFGIFPLNRGRHSGLLPPRFTSNDVQGLGLEGLGFYKVINDNWDTRLESDLYSYGGWRADVTTDYYKRYKYRGSFIISTQHTKQLNTDLYNLSKNEFIVSNTYFFTWTHSSDSKARPGTSFSANVHAGSTQYNSNVPNNAFLNYNNSLASSISYNKLWGEGKYNLNVSLNENQNSVTRLINLNLPTVTFSTTTIYPFQKKDQAGEPKWYQKLGIGYTGNLLNSISFYDSAFDFKKLLDTTQWGVDHRIPITLSLPPVGPLIFAPSIDYEEKWFAQKINYAWDEKTNKIDTTIKKGFYAARETSFGLSMNTRIFGTYNFRHSEGVQAIRHEIDPFIGLSYKPNLVSQFYQTVQVDSSGKNFRRVSQQGSILGGFSEGRFGGLTFGINNLLEMKVKNHKDSTGADSVKKIRLLDNFGISSGINLIPDSSNRSTPISPISIRAGSSLFNKVNITAGATINPYRQDTAGINHLLWKKGSIGDFQSGNLSISTSLQSKSKDKQSDKQRLARDEDETLTPDEQQAQLQDVRDNPGEYVDFSIPWTLQLSYSLSYNRYLSSNLIDFTSKLSTNLNVNGTVSLSPKWQLGGGFYFDFISQKLQASNIFLTRDMHCWQMVIDVQVGQYKSFTITLNPKSGILRDLHINKHFLQQ
ncbi:MAG: putative LPS assembly protein LptD, partial [Parafilimonas sp.]